MPGTSAPILAVDVGSTSVKAARYTRDGERSGGVVEVRHRQNGGGDLDVAHVLTAVLAAFAGLPLGGVEVVATTALWQSLVVEDGEGRVDARATTWETRHPASVMGAARAVLAPVWDGRATGAFVHSSYPLLAAAGTRAAVGQVTEQRRLLDIGGWVIETLTGTRSGWSEPIAAGSGVWDQAARRWHRAISERAGVSDGLTDPPVRAPITVTSPHPSLPAALRDAVWLPPLPDGLCHNLGAGAVDDVVTATVGTSGSIRAVVRDVSAPAPAGLWAYRCAEHTLAIGGAVSSVGNVLEWVEGFTGVTVDWPALAGDRPRLPTVRAVPDVFGRRGPDYPSDATGTIEGLRPEHTRADVAVAFAVDLWSTFADLFVRYRSVRPVAAVRTGGGVIERHPVSAQLLADALDHPVEVPTVLQPALRGAALFGAVSLADRAALVTVDDVVEAIVRGDVRTPVLGRVVAPRPAWTATLAERWQIPAGPHPSTSLTIQEPT